MQIVEGGVTDSQDLTHVSITERKHLNIMCVVYFYARSFTSKSGKIIYCEIILIFSFPRRWEMLAWLTISMASLPFLRNVILFLEDSMNYCRILLLLERDQIRIPHDDVFTLQYGSHLQ